MTSYPDPPARIEATRDNLPALCTVLLGFAVTAVFLLLTRSGDAAVLDKFAEVYLAPWQNDPWISLCMSRLELCLIFLGFSALMFYLSVLQSLIVAQHEFDINNPYTNYKENAKPDDEMLKKWRAKREVAANGSYWLFNCGIISLLLSLITLIKMEYWFVAILGMLLLWVIFALWFSESVKKKTKRYTNEKWPGSVGGANGQ
jgi:hypothetical protein